MALHRFLDGRGPAPQEWLISRLCEEFGCLPSAAEREVAIMPTELLESIVEMRVYATVRRAYKEAKTRADVDRIDHPMLKMVMEHDFALAEESGEGDQ